MIEPKKIKEINFSDNIYFIPSYQRGYRWDRKQVEELLDDIYEVYLTKQESYCLQPIVVSKIEENKYEIIDGQQRLTTIYILLTRFKRFIDEKFQLDFEVRQNCVDFFKRLDGGSFDYSNPDFAHISNAYKVIDSWLNIKKETKVDSNVEMNIFQTLLERVEVIWYDVEESNREELVKVFTRLNSGKIGLTNAELIKALFLSKANFENQSKDVYTHQLDISNKWNQIENALQNDDFWNFINKSENKLATRIDYIFQLIVRNKNLEIKEKFDVFRYYYPLYVKSRESKEYDFIESNWNEIDLYFTILQDWYSNHEYYHLIGLLIWDGADELALIREYQESNKKLFVKYLFEEIGNRFCNIKVEDLDYINSYNQVERTLVFFNVMEVYRSKTNRFPFKQLKVKEIKWSLEHIHPQNALDVKQSEYSQWLEDHKKVLRAIGSDDELTDRIENLIVQLKEINAKNLRLQFEDLSREVLENLDYKENNRESISKKSKIPFEKLIGEHHISNMALLDTKKNSSLGNSAFGVKRKSIIDFELKGFYIPNATKNSFLKYYSDYPKCLNYWTLEDRDEYLFKIQEQMNFVKTQNLETYEY
ncbi:DUF262 domain-containing protein [Pedobacter sp. SL55]|uniref:DUF262 domain-containing protein n=1 Tax=Pedobacter sp. SL55 TaxID=2995161 RepID=UPI00226EF4EB|nr:DUF262 domain-containing protein [Pedobacter sp. SL55]WAC39105.1 DUF262 domain-containing protein [Pedobacter sp. SL55]